MVYGLHLHAVFWAHTRDSGAKSWHTGPTLLPSQALGVQVAESCSQNAAYCGRSGMSMVATDNAPYILTNRAGESVSLPGSAPPIYIASQEAAMRQVGKWSGWGAAPCRHCST